MNAAYSAAADSPPTAPTASSTATNHTSSSRRTNRDSHEPTPIAVMNPPMVSEKWRAELPSRYDESVPTTNSYRMPHVATTRTAASSTRVWRRPSPSASGGRRA